MIWAAGFGSLVIACAALLALRVRVRAQVKAMAHAGGTWKAAAGGAVGPIAFTAGLSADGLPLGLQVIGRAFDEAMVLRVGQALETAAQFTHLPTFIAGGG